MDTVKIQLTLFWVSVAFCFIGTFFFVSSVTFKKEKHLKYGVWNSYLAAVPMLVALALRWIQTGHYPNMGMYEVFSSYGGGALFFYLAIQVWKPNLKIAGLFVVPVSMIMVGVAVMNSTEITQMPATFYMFWLWIHMLFAKLSYGAVIICGALAVIYLLKSRQQIRGSQNPLLDQMPSLERTDYLAFRFGYFAFVMLGVMIASGSVWAYKAWGRYWGWDPIETWALVSWLVFGLYIHLRKTWGWQGKRAAWLAIVAVLVLIFAFFGIPLVYPSVHGHVINAAS